MLKMVVILLGLVAPLLSYGWVIQNVSGLNSYWDTEIRKYAIFLENEVVKYGRCDSLEAECFPDSPTFKLSRQLPYVEYQTLLAEYFGISPKQLINDEGTSKNFQAGKVLALKTIESENSSDSEREAAQKKFDLLTQKGGIVDRFEQALAIKRSLRWDPEDRQKHLATFEKSEKRFAQSAWPMNFAKDIEAKDPLRIFEPSTEKVWVFAGNNVNRIEASRLCSGLGTRFRLPDASEWKEAQKWLVKSSIVESMAAVKTNGKTAWLSAVSTAERTAKVSKLLNQYSTRAYDVIVTYHDPLFQFATVFDENESLKWETLSGTESKEGMSFYLENYGAKTSLRSALCVADWRVDLEGEE